jgi:hypothetical protein
MAEALWDRAGATERRMVTPWVDINDTRIAAAIGGERSGEDS